MSSSKMEKLLRSAVLETELRYLKSASPVDLPAGFALSWATLAKMQLAVP
jgi:hypothetical protein